MFVVRLYLARERAGVGGWVGAEAFWMFWRIDISIACAKICTPDLPTYIVAILMIVLPHTDLKIIPNLY
jgi:hypothetical protein